MHGGRGKKEVQVGLLNLFLDIFVSFGRHLNRVHGGRGKKEVQVGRRNLFLALFFVQELGRGNLFGQVGRRLNSVGGWEVGRRLNRVQVGRGRIL